MTGTRTVIAGSVLFAAGLLAGQSASSTAIGNAQPSGSPAAGQQSATQPPTLLAPQPPAAQPDSPQADAKRAPVTAQEPKTEILDSSSPSGGLAGDGHDPILDPPALPGGDTTLVGGIISSLDRIRNRISVAIYGGGHWTILFDERTHIYRNGAEVTQLALKKGDRVYVDTMLDNNRRDVFARNIRVGVVVPPADVDGQIEETDAKHNEITVRDSVGASSVRFVVDAQTRISRGPAAASFSDLHPGALVRIKFAADRIDRGLAREISILALPGSTFTFAGPITFLDTHRGVLAVHNIQDGKTYDLHFAPARTPEAGRLAVGTEVSIVATFNSTEYTAKEITVTKAAREAGK
jgi:hypothetical protein